MDHVDPIPFVAGTYRTISLSKMYETKHQVSGQQLLGNRKGDLDSALVVMGCDKSE